jgi:hypothetical protein
MSFVLKDPDAVLDYMIDWGAEYLGVDQLSSSDWAVVPDEPGGVAVVLAEATITLQVQEPAVLISSDSLSDMTGSVTITVVQIGDFAESRPLIATVEI